MDHKDEQAMFRKNAASALRKIADQLDEGKASVDEISIRSSSRWIGGIGPSKVEVRGRHSGPFEYQFEFDTSLDWFTSL